jgi:hypothetical protein
VPQVREANLRLFACGNFVGNFVIVGPGREPSSESAAYIFQTIPRCAPARPGNRWGRALSAKGNPRLSTLVAVTKAIGLKLTVEAA